MKSSKQILNSLLLTILLTSISTTAQESSGVNLAITTAQSGVLALNCTDIASISSLSDPELADFLNVLNATPTVPMDALPLGGRCGTFWSLQNPNSPPLPFDVNGADVWLLSDGSYLLNDVAPSAGTPAGRSALGAMTMSAMSGDLSPPGAGDGGDTNYWPNGLSNSIPNYGTNLWIARPAATSGYLAGVGSNTLADVQYEIQSRTNLALQANWQTEGFVFGSELTNWTPFSVPQNGRTNLFVRLKSWASSDGSGIPDWWAALYGLTNVDPNAQDSAGDGWTIYQKYQIGLNPNAWFTPPAPQNFTANLNATNGAVTLNWLRSPGPITGYSLQKSDWQTGIQTTIPISANAVSYGDSIAGEAPVHPPELIVNYTIQAQYGTNGPSAAAAASIRYASLPKATIVIGTQGRLSLAIPNLPSDLSYLQLYRQQGNVALDWDAIDGWYGEEDTFSGLNSPLSDGYFAIPASGVSNGICQIPDAQAPPFFNYTFWVQTVRSNGVASGWEQLGALNLFGWAANLPFVDARQQLKDNLRFLLRAAADESPFAFTVAGDSHWYLPPVFAWPFNNYVYSGFYGEGGESYYGSFNELHPIHANCFYRNFVYDQYNLNHAGLLKTGCYGGNSYDSGFGFNLPCLTITNFPTYYFNVAGYLTNNVAIPSSQLTTNQTQWLLLNDGGVVSLNGEAVPTHNFYGLPYISMKCAYVNTNNQQILATYYPGDSLPSGVNGVKYFNAAQPVFTNVGYYFARPSIDPLPEQSGLSGFDTASLTPSIVQGVGSSQQIAGYSQLEVQNSSFPGYYAYLGQYFDKSYKIDANGHTTTNTTGVLSPYGNFFATEPGPTALVTMPDVDTGQRGTCTVYSVSIALDKNHDGNMDLSFNAADATSANSPLVFWANNNYDRWHNVDGSDSEQDDLGPADIAKLPSNQQMYDAFYVTNGLPAIPCTRDLEDYFRLWLPGVAAAMNAMPDNYTVQLTLSGDGQIQIFRAIEQDGGTNYLFNETTASSQVASSTSLYVGLLNSNLPIVFSCSTNFNEHFIVCGAHAGTAQIDLQIVDGSGNIIADSPTYLQINDIKQMYERWTVGENPSRAPLTVAEPGTEDMPNGTPAFQYAAPADTNTPYILFVHGWNMERWEKDRFAEAAYKRLYWQGYRGRFGEFRWPTANRFSGIISALFDAHNYDNSESNAWSSARGLLNKLTALNAEYPGQIYLMAHSMGNVVAGEALKLAGTNQVVNTYIAMQGAVPAHAYDAAAPNRTTQIYPNFYAHYWTGSSACYFNGSAGAGTYVNFFNTNDWALSWWRYDQDFKPDSGYSYRYANGQTNFYSGSDPAWTILLFPADRYSIFAYCDPAWSYALGAQADVGGPFQLLGAPQQVRLPTIWPIDAHPRTDNKPYSAHVWHSAQFRSDNPNRAIFWNTVLNRMRLFQ